LVVAEKEEAVEPAVAELVVKWDVVVVVKVAVLLLAVAEAESRVAAGQGVVVEKELVAAVQQQVLWEPL